MVRTEDSKVIIAVSELMVIVIGAIVSGARWAGRLVFYVGDNQNVVTWLETRKSKNAYARFLLMLLQLVETRHKFVVIGFYIRSRHNKTADLLTREVRKVAAKEAEDLGLVEIEKVMEILLDFVERGYERRALAWAGQDPAQRQAVSYTHLTLPTIYSV